VAAADILLAAGRAEAARDRYRQAHALMASSSLAADVKQDDEVARHYDVARVALARHDVAAARADAAAYESGAAARKNDARIRQSHELNGLVALEEKQFDASLQELARADQESPAVWYAMARAYAGKGDSVKAKQLSEQAVHLNVLPTFPYVFTRVAIAGATRSATSENAHGRPR
jgi:tetratricopeptide (TPR) repeat protein